MKKTFLLVSIIAALAMTGCGKGAQTTSQEPEQDSSSSKEESRKTTIAGNLPKCIG